MQSGLPAHTDTMPDPVRGMTGRSRAVRGQLHVSAACEIMHKALPLRHEYGGSEFDGSGSHALSAAREDASQ